MPRFRFSSSPDSQIDPFNAGDPVMPGGEPDPLDETAHADSTANEPSYAPHGDKDGVAHKPSDNYRAPTTGGHSYDAPSIDVPAQVHIPGQGQHTARAHDAVELPQTLDDHGVLLLDHVEQVAGDNAHDQKDDCHHEDDADEASQHMRSLERMTFP